jgi:hypothetical protein
MTNATASGTRGRDVREQQRVFWVIAMAGFAKRKRWSDGSVCLQTFRTVADTKEQAEAIGLLKWRDENPGAQDCIVIANGPYTDAPTPSSTHRGQAGEGE